MKLTIKILLIPFSFFILLTYTFAQEEDKEKRFKQLLTEAVYYIELENYNLALNTYLQLDSIDPGNANIQYRIGICQLKSTVKKARAIPYLEKAILNTSGTYDDLSVTKKNAPYDAYYQLAKAYHLNFQFDTAIATYKKYKSLLDTKHYLQEEIDRQIEMSFTAKIKVADPIDVEIVNLGPGINTKYADFGPVINADETMMIFTSRREGSTGGKKELDGRYFEDIYVSYNDTGVWSPPKKIGSNINSINNEAASGLSADGQRLFIYKNYGGGDIYQSYFIDDTWSLLEKLGSNINTQACETHASITPDGNLLYFVSDRKDDGYGGKDIYKCKKLPNGEWAKAQNLGPVINTKYDEDAPYIHPDEGTLFFSSKGHKTMGGFDIFFSQLSDDGQWSESWNIGYPINTPDDDIYYAQSIDGMRSYYSSVNTDKGLGEKDIYRADHISRKKRALTVLKGTMAVTDSKGLSMKSQIIVTDNTTGENFIHKPSDNNGKYLIILKPGKDYSFKFVMGDSIVHSENIYIPEESSYQEIEKEFVLPPIGFDESVKDEVEEPVESTESIESVEPIEPTETVEIVEPVETVESTETVETDKEILESDFGDILFNFDRSTIKQESYPILRKLIKILNEYPDVKVEISGHTDHIGPASYNQKLSERRGLAVVDYLIKQGINKERLISKGYGESRPTAPNVNPDGSDNPKGRALNRRTELSILGSGT
ncbi:MAG: OmpA family protein [Bacteroidota bacterium]